MIRVNIDAFVHFYHKRMIGVITSRGERVAVWIIDTNLIACIVKSPDYYI